VFGGWNGKQGLSDVHVLSLSKMEWFVPRILGDPPTPRNNHATFVVGSKLFVHGGHDGSDWLSDMYVLEVGTDAESSTWRWTRPSLSGSAPSARACHCIVVHGRKAFCFGGYDGARCFNDMDELDLDTLTWSRLKVLGDPPQARNAASLTVVGDRLFLFGGHSGTRHLPDLWIFDVPSLTWTHPETSGSRPPGLRGHTANVVGDKLILFAGYDGRSRSNELFMLSTTSLTWEHPPAAEGTPAGRQRHTMCSIGPNKLMAFGGFDGFRWLEDCHVLDVGRLDQTAINSASLQALRSDLASLVNNPDSFPDIVFRIDSERIFAHRAILWARASHFRAMFSSGMAETKDGAEIIVEGWTAEAFLAMLEYLYTGKAPSTSPVITGELMSLADHYALDGLKAICETQLIQHVDAPNVCALYTMAHRCSASELKRHCLDFILLSADVDLDELAGEPSLLMEITRASLKKRKGTNA
jgi:leucine-zipper-like transcriptional regulator 1